MTNDERKERYEAAKEAFLLDLYLVWAGLKYEFWSRVPHRHKFETSAICTRCYGRMSDLFR
jgi:hypothetical protein